MGKIRVNKLPQNVRWGSEYGADILKCAEGILLKDQMGLPARIS